MLYLANRQVVTGTKGGSKIYGRNAYKLRKGYMFTYFQCMRKAANIWFTSAPCSPPPPTPQACFQSTRCLGGIGFEPYWAWLVEVHVCSGRAYLQVWICSCELRKLLFTISQANNSPSMSFLLRSPSRWWEMLKHAGRPENLTWACWSRGRSRKGVFAQNFRNGW